MTISVLHLIDLGKFTQSICKFCFEATYSPERRAAIFPELMAQSMEGWKEARSVMER